jgi:peptidylprolyl isomerase
MRFFILVLLSLSLAVTAEKTPTVVMQTTAGVIELKFFPEVAPKAVENFITHAKNGYYDKGSFHRIIRNFMIQGGDPQGTGRGGKSIWGKGFAIEVSPTVTFNRAGLLAMAKTRAPKSQGSQFFITTAAAPHLNGGYTIFGEITPESMKVLRALEATPTKGDRPYTKPRIITMKVKP